MAIDGVTEASISLAGESLRILAQESIGDAVIEQAREIVKRHEPHVGFKPLIRKNDIHSKEEESPEHGHSHGEDQTETGPFGIDYLKWNLGRIISSLFLFGVSFIVGDPVSLIVLILAYIIAGHEIVWTALRNLTRGLVFDENFLMTLATVGAFAIGEYSEAVGVMLFYMIGEYFQDLAVYRSRRSIKDLLDIRPEYAVVERSGKHEKVHPEDVQVGETILIRQGERVPLDGVVLSGYSQLDTKALTGESIPREIEGGNDILSGSINLTSALTVKVTKPYGESTVSKIMELVENSSHNKGKTEKYITKFARIYTPAVVALALIVAFIVPQVLGQPFAPWIRKALVFLVISCPCALVISIPLGFFGGIGLASRNGILIKGSNFLEELKNIKTVVLDKTGTVTKGSFRVTQVVPAKGLTKDRVLHLAALAEVDSPHPIAKSILAELPQPLDRSHLETSEELRGQGIKATLKDKTVIFAGNDKLMKSLGLEVEHPIGTIIFVAVQEADTVQYIGRILIEDEIKPDSALAIADMKKMGVKNIIMLSGDNLAIVKKVAEGTGITDYRASLLPQDKVEAIYDLNSDQTRGEFTAFAGDGLNDTPVLKLADIGISMGAIGSSAAIEASDVVLMDDSLTKIPIAMNISRLTNRIVLQNIVFAMGFKVAVMIQSIFFKENIWLAIFADVGVALLAVLNASRLSRMDPTVSTEGINLESIPEEIAPAVV